MGISYIPGPEALLAPAAQQIASGLERFINPNLQFQRQMQAALATNPALIQQLADLESNAPGLLQQMGFGELGNSIANVPQSIQAMIQQGSRGAVTEALRDKSNVDIAATRAVTGQTPTEISTDKVRKLLAEKGYAAMEDPEVAAYVGRASVGYKPGDVASDKYQEQTFTKGLQMLSEGPDVTISKFLNNEYSPSELNAIFATPMGQALSAQLGIYSDRIRAAAMKDNKSETLAKLYQAEAFQLSRDTGVYDLPAALGVVTGKTTRDNATPEAKKIFDAIDQMKAEKKAERIANNSKNISIQLNAYQKAKDDETRKGIVTAIDEMLNANTTFGAPRYRAVFEQTESKMFPGPSKNMVFKDPFGNTVPAEVAVAAVPPSPQAENTALINRAYQDVMKSKNKAAALKALEAANPAVYGEVLRKMGTTGEPITVTP
jgi:hypothetical protein